METAIIPIKFGSRYTRSSLTGRYGWEMKLTNNLFPVPNQSHFSTRKRGDSYFIELKNKLPPKSRDSDWLRAGRPRGRSSSPGRVKNFLFFKSSRPALGFTQPPIQWVPGVTRPRSRKCGSIHPPPHKAS
jgi:hypothetical protein